MGGFKKFLLRGNLVDLAVAFVIGAAFAALVTAFIEDLITPIIAAIGGQPDFGALAFHINGSKFSYGAFINALITFVLLAAVIYFFVVKPFSALLDRYQKAPDPGRAHPRLPGVPQLHPGSSQPLRVLHGTVRARRVLGTRRLRQALRPPHRQVSRRGGAVARRGTSRRRAPRHPAADVSPQPASVSSEVCSGRSSLSRGLRVRCGRGAARGPGPRWPGLCVSGLPPSTANTPSRSRWLTTPTTTPASTTGRCLIQLLAI